MKFTLYQTKSEVNEVNKSLSNPLELSGTLRESTDAVNPVIMIEAINPTKYNYAYIPEFGRYYFIQEFESVRTGLWRVKMHVDVLKTYAAEIKNTFAIINKQAVKSNGDVYLNDGSFVLTSKSFSTILNFSNGFNDNGEFILITAGA